jgi:prepilin-type N-terminal cleavage/methylation domain-containing protein
VNRLLPALTAQAPSTRGAPGFTLIELMFVVAVIAIIVAIAIPSLMRSRTAANEASAISSLRTMTSMNERYNLRFGRYAGALTDLSNAGLIDQNLGGGTKAGYTFAYTGGTDTFSCAADPEIPGTSGSSSTRPA